MARRQAQSGKKFKFKGFINVEFTNEEKDAISQHIIAFEPQAEDSLVVLVEAGYKVSFSWDEYHSVNQVALTCRDSGSKYYGYVITLKHSDIFRSINILRHLYDTALKDGLYPIEVKTRSHDW